MYDVYPTKLPGCIEMQPRVIEDERGRFVKPFHAEEFSTYNLETCFVEEYYSVSWRGVLRGLHFQLPPLDHAKLVYCVEGSVLDAVVDLRVGSPSYGQHAIFELNAKHANSIYIPRGMAHGFYVQSERATLVYKVSTVYSPEYDAGILWNSVGIPWPSEKPIISDRDQGFPSFSEFQSPFIYE